MPSTDTYGAETMAGFSDTSTRALKLLERITEALEAAVKHQIAPRRKPPKSPAMTLLEAHVEREALRLAVEVLEGRVDRQALEHAVRDTGDGEPALALQYLDGEVKLMP